MKFKFCSGGDCPLWALAGLHALSSLPAGLFRSLLHQVTQEQPDDGIMELLKNTNLSSREECARAAGVIRWVVSSSLRCGCSSVALTRDLLVLGVPRAHATALAEAVEAAKGEHETKAKENGLFINKLTDATVSPGPEGVVDTIKLSLHSEDVITGEQSTNDIIIDKANVPELLAELKKAYDKMESIE